MSTLFDSVSGDLLPFSRHNSRVLWSRCFLVLRTWSFQVSRLSKCNPRYLIVSVRGLIELFMYTGGQVFLHSVNVICADLVSFILSLHFSDQRSSQTNMKITERKSLTPLIKVWLSLRRFWRNVKNPFLSLRNRTLSSLQGLAG